MRVSGVGQRMNALIGEYNSILEDGFDLRFRYPTVAQLKEIRTLHRDRSPDEISEIEQDLNGLSRLLQRVDSGQISLDALPPEAQRLVRRLANENTGASDPSRSAR